MGRGKFLGLGRAQRAEVDGHQRTVAYARAPCRIDRVPLDPAGHDQDHGQLRQRLRQFRQPVDQAAVGPVDVLDPQQQRAFAGQRLDETGGHPVPACGPRLFVHRIEERAQIGWLRQIEQLVQVNDVARIDESLVRTSRHGARAFALARRRAQPEQTAQDRRYRPPAAPCAEIEHQPRVTAHAKVGGDLEIAFDQLRLADPRFAAHEHHLLCPGLAAVGEHAFEPAQLRAAPDECAPAPGAMLARHVGDTPDAHGRLEALHLDLAHLLARHERLDRAVDGIRHIGRARFG